MTVDHVLARTTPKPPPENPEAEASLLGAVLIDPTVYENVVRGRIAPASLSREQHRLILGAVERVESRMAAEALASIFDAFVAAVKRTPVTAA